jgi:putative salt-induced outer membrane protein
MFNLQKPISVLILLFISSTALAQQSAVTNDVMTEVELGAIFTSGNTEDENVKYKITVDWLRGNYDTQFSSEGFRSSKENVLAAQRLYHVARTRYALTEDSYWMARTSYEDDRFSGYDYQADATLSYGRNFLQSIDSMSLSADIGAGARKSVSDAEDFSEGIIRASAEYEWSISDTANFFQNISAEVGEETSIYRSETGIESEIMENLSMRFSIKVKNQSDVPVGREKTDTETAITLVWNF